MQVGFVQLVLMQLALTLVQTLTLVAAQLLVQLVCAVWLQHSPALPAPLFAAQCAAAPALSKRSE